MDRRDDFGTWQDSGSHSDRRGYEPGPLDEGYVVPRQEARYSSMADLNERRRPTSGVPSSPGPAIRGHRSGEPPTAALQEPTSSVDSASVRRAVAESDGLYRSARPAFAVLFSILGTLGVVLMIKPFLAGAFGAAASPALAPLLAMIAFPLLAFGMYGLFTGAAAAVHFQGPRVWLKTPLVYLPIALVLLIAAGTAA